MGIDVKALSDRLLPDYLRFFDEVAFSDNPAWAPCYCVYYHHDPTERPWEQRTAGENRAYARELVEAGRLKGYLAYDGEHPIGWCNVNDKRAYALLATEKDLWDPDEQQSICSIVCFVVAPGRRGQGIASTLLAAACADLQGRAFDVMEAYPRTNVSGSAASYHGTLSMYGRAGFSVHRELESVRIVRRKLR